MARRMASPAIPPFPPYRAVLQLYDTTLHRGSVSIVPCFFFLAGWFPGKQKKQAILSLFFFFF